MSKPFETLDEPTHVARTTREVTYLFVVLDGHCPRNRGARYDLTEIDEIVIGRGESSFATRVEAQLGLHGTSPSMSSRHARIIRSGTRWIIEDLGSRNGTFVDGLPVRSQQLEEGAIVETGRLFFLIRRGPVTPVAGDLTADGLVAEPLGLRTLLPELSVHHGNLTQIARSPVSVLLLGPTGTGKELLARSVHQLSGRRGSFVPVNCGGLPAALVEGLLFGHARGSFSGALRDQPGLVRAAHGGTLFLDEIGDLPIASQATLLRILQEHEVLPVGESKPVHVDLRVVAATHRSLDEAVRAGLFRADLLTRLRGFTHHLVPLRDRREDFGMIVGDLLDKVAPQSPQLSFSPVAARALLRYPWPGNIRELEHCLAAAAVLATEGCVEPRHLPGELLGDDSPDRETPNVSTPQKGSVPLMSSPADEALLASLLDALKANGGNVAAVSRTMGKAPYQIHRWLARFRIDLSAFRAPK